ncbi:MAG TPA: ATPase domain-containing protein [Myxococcota bacterium]|jgi:KaiC/GvpD/RAD55 family RecA-like ATPase
MAAKKKAEDVATAPVAQQQPQGMMQPGMMQPGMMQPGMMQPGMMQPGMQQPGMMPQQMMGGFNPMAMMMQMMQSQMMQGGFGTGFGGIDPSAMPFAQPVPGQIDGDPGLDAAIIRPATLENRVKSQRALKLGNVLDLLCLSEDAKHALGGVPEGCTMVFVGPPGQGKTRTALASLARVAQTGKKVAFVVAEEGFHDEDGRGRDDLCSRMVKVGMAATGLDEKAFADKVLVNMFVLEAQYHKSVTWDDFIKKYRYLVEKEGIELVVIDSLNMIDPTKKGTADNLSALKTYNHEKGVTCMCIGQIKDTGEPVGGEALQHTADVVFLLEEMGLSSKEIAELWGGKYRDKISVLHIVKSVTTPTLQFPVRVDRKPGTGELVVHDLQPKEYPLLDVKK